MYQNTYKVKTTDYNTETKSYLRNLHDRKSNSNFANTMDSFYPRQNKNYLKNYPSSYNISTNILTKYHSKNNYSNKLEKGLLTTNNDYYLSNYYTYQNNPHSTSNISLQNNINNNQYTYKNNYVTRCVSNNNYKSPSNYSNSSIKVYNNKYNTVKKENKPNDINENDLLSKSSTNYYSYYNFSNYSNSENKSNLHKNSLKNLLTNLNEYQTNKFDYEKKINNNIENDEIKQKRTKVNQILNNNYITTKSKAKSKPKNINNSVSINNNTYTNNAKNKSNFRTRHKSSINININKINANDKKNIRHYYKSIYSQDINNNLISNNDYNYYYGGELYDMKFNSNLDNNKTNEENLKSYFCTSANSYNNTDENFSYDNIGNRNINQYLNSNKKKEFSNSNISGINFNNINIGINNNNFILDGNGDKAYQTFSGSFGRDKNLNNSKFEINELNDEVIENNHSQGFYIKSKKEKPKTSIETGDNIKFWEFNKNNNYYSRTIDNNKLNNLKNNKSNTNKEELISENNNSNYNNFNRSSTTKHSNSSISLTNNNSSKNYYSDSLGYSSNYFNTQRVEYQNKINENNYFDGFKRYYSSNINRDDNNDIYNNNNFYRSQRISYNNIFTGIKKNKLEYKSKLENIRERINDLLNIFVCLLENKNIINIGQTNNNCVIKNNKKKYSNQRKK